MTTADYRARLWAILAFSLFVGVMATSLPMLLVAVCSSAWTVKALWQSHRSRPPVS